MVVSVTTLGLFTAVNSAVMIAAIAKVKRRQANIHAVRHKREHEQQP